MTWGDVVVTDEMRWDALSLDRGESIDFDHVVEGWGYILHWYTRGRQRDAFVFPSKGQLPVLIRKRDVTMSTFDMTFGETMQRDLYTNLVTGAHTEYPGGVTAEVFMRSQTPTPPAESGASTFDPMAKRAHRIPLMEDGPDEADGIYEYGGRTYRLEEAAREVWSVYLGDTYLGVVRATEPIEGEPGPHYVAKLAGEEHEPDGEVTDGWRAALDLLIDESAE